jgi:membrane-associated phospholipid phosphatase
VRPAGKAVPLAKQMRGLPSFDLSKLPAMAGGGLLGILRAAIKPSFIAIVIVALGLIVASHIYVDRDVATWLNKFQNSGITGIFRKITDLGSAKVMLALPFIAAIGFFLVSHFIRNADRAARMIRLGGQAFFVFCCVAAPAAVGLFAKILIGRARPQLLFEQQVYGFTPMSFNDLWHSMPSGHSLSAAGFAAGLALVLPLPAFPVICFFGAMIAFSRVATTAHYFGDAMAGGALAIVCALLVKGAFKGAGFRKLFPTWDPNKKLRLRSISLSMRRGE